MPNYEVELTYSARIVVMDAEGEDTAIDFARCQFERVRQPCDSVVRLLKDEELDTAVSQADAVSQP